MQQCYDFNIFLKILSNKATNLRYFFSTGLYTFYGDLIGTRTRVCAVRGRRPNR